MTKSNTPRRGAKALVRDQQTRERLTTLGAVLCGMSEVAEDLGSTEAEVAEFLAGWTDGREAFENAAAEARQQLRAAQFKLAEKSPTMAIFLGRQYLGQAERREFDASARAAEIAADAEFVRAALAALAADCSSPGVPGGDEDGERRDPPGDPL
jgi:hypothetical protein